LQAWLPSRIPPKYVPPACLVSVPYLFGSTELGEDALVGHEVSVDALLPDVHGLHQVPQGLGVLGPRQLQQAEQADGEELGVLELALLGSAGNSCQQFLNLQGKPQASAPWPSVCENQC